MPKKISTCPHVSTVGGNSWEDVDKIKQLKGKCETCRAEGPNLWLCLHSRCLYVGCGESSEDHSSSHTESLQHFLTLNMTTMRIWCYACESEVYKDGNNPPLIMKSSVGGSAPASPKKTASPSLSDSVSSSPNLNILRQEDTESDEEDGNLKPRGLTGLQNVGNTCYMNAAIQSLSNCPPLTQFFLECPGFVRTDKKPMLSRSYQKLMQEMWHRKRPSYVVPSGVAHGIKLVHPMFRGYTQQDSQEFLRCFMDQIHEELKQPEVTVPNGDEDADSANSSMSPSQQSIDSSVGFDRSHDISLSAETPTPDRESAPCKGGTTNSTSSPHNTDTDYETCDSGMSSERSSVESGTIGVVGVEEENHGSCPVPQSGKDSCPRPGHARKRRSGDKNKINPDDTMDGVISTSNVHMVDEKNAQNVTSSKDRKDTANMANQRASSQERPVTVGAGGDSPDTDFTDAVSELEPLQGRSRTLSGRSQQLESEPSRHSSSRQTKESFKKKTPPQYCSVISDVFDGRLLSSVQCLTCERVSSTKETFQDLSLPIPSKDHLHMIHASHTQNSNSHKGTCGEVNLNQGWFSWMFGWMRGWFWGPMITLHHCLAAFFSADDLKGDNMYSCEKCKKLRNGLKFSKVMKLPEVLCIHLKRFRHEFMFSSKISSYVSFPLEGLDLGPYLHKDCTDQVTQYDLVGVICHHGTAGGGHYTAYGLNHLNQQWYEFDDQYVTEVDQQVIENCEAYVLFYRKKNAHMQSIRQKAEQIMTSTESSIMNFYVSRQWFNKFNTFAEPGPISNSDILCQHGAVPPSKWSYVGELVKEVPQSTWEFMHDQFGGGPAVNHLSQCKTCLLELEKVKRRQKYEIDAFIQLNNEFQNEESPGTIYAISMAWFRDWENFVRAKTDEAPGPIENKRISIMKGGQQTVKLSSDYGQLSEHMWHFLVNIYGGGPELVLRQNLQPAPGSSPGNSCEETNPNTAEARA